MGETKDNDAYEEELLDYEEEEDKVPDSVATKVNGESAKKSVHTLYSILSPLSLRIHIYF